MITQDSHHPTRLDIPVTKVIINVVLDYDLSQPCTAILMIDAAETDGQILGDTSVRLGDSDTVHRIAADEGIGERIMMACEKSVRCNYRCEVEVTRSNPKLDELIAAPIEALDGEAYRYTLPSRFCEHERFQNFVQTRFGNLEHGKKVAAIRDWIEDQLEYVPGASHGETGAADTFLDRQGVCRDYAHLMIAMCRSAQIPARFCSVYAPSVDPQDFHAVTQVYLSGEWHLVDPTGMATADEMVLIAVGRDATDVAFMTTTGPAEFKEQSVSVERVN